MTVVRDCSWMLLKHSLFHYLLLQDWAGLMWHISHHVVRFYLAFQVFQMDLICILIFRFTCGFSLALTPIRAIFEDKLCPKVLR